MFRPVMMLAALALGAAPAAAANYSARLVTPASGLIAARDIAWTCTPSGCQGATENSRPAVLCQSLAKRVGRIDSFLVNGTPIAATDLARCNASAKTSAQTAVAAR